MPFASFSDPPKIAAWELRDATRGFEVVFIDPSGDGYRIEGHSTGVEDGEPWGLEYAIDLDRGWRTRSAEVRSRTSVGRRELTLKRDGGCWLANGDRVPEVEGLLDVDLEASSFTNAFPVHRLGLEVGEQAEAPAAYVRTLDLRIERLDQSYARLPDEGDRVRYRYLAPAFNTDVELVYDQSGLAIDYPGIAVRVF